MMTEPVAYLNKYLDNSTNITRYKPENQRLLTSNPLYTAEQLQPRVNMTKRQYARLMWDKENTNLSTCLGYFLNSDDNHFGLSSGNLRGDLTQEDIALAWLNPYETIEIVPDMKWFVRSKEPGENDYYSFLQNTVQLELNWCYGKDKDKPLKIAQHFDTKEEAEEWKNPLTEAVLLPVEE